MNTTYYIGLDVHSQNTAIAHALEGSREDPVFFGSCGGSVQNVERILRKLAKKLEVEFKDLKVSYEAGPTGFVLARRLISLGLECVVTAPTKSERKPGDKVKIAVARELCAFIWELQHIMRDKLPVPTVTNTAS